MGNTKSSFFPGGEDPDEEQGGGDHPTAPIAYIDSGSSSADADSDDDVSLFGTYSNSFNDPKIAVKGDNPDFVAFGRSHRWSPGNFGYLISVPVPGEYDVTLVFCETYSGAYHPGGRVFNIEVEGTGDKRTAYDVDVAKTVGPNTVHTIKFDNVQADMEIRVKLNKGKMENPFISGLVVGAPENAKPSTLPKVPAPNVTVTAEQYDECRRKIAAYIKKKEDSAPTHIRERPFALFHKPGTKVRGLVVTYHGFSGTYYDHRVVAKYLYVNGYDVFNTMLAGHMYSGDHWPVTVLSDEYGGDTVQATVARDREAQQLLAESSKNPAVIPRLLRRLREVDPEFSRLPSANDYMTAIEDDEDPDFSKIFSSSHRDYLTEGDEQLHLVDAHPGPVGVMGLSAGGSAAMAVAGANADRVSKCVTMAPLLEIWEPIPNTRRLLVNALGPLRITPPFDWDPRNPFQVASLTAAGRLGGSITSSSKMVKAFQEKVRMFMVLTADEDAADVPTNRKFFKDCGGRLKGHQYHFYPMKYVDLRWKSDCNFDVCR